LGLKGKVTGRWRKLHNEKLPDLYTTPNIISVLEMRMRCVGHVKHMGEERIAYLVMVRKCEGRRSLGIPRQRWLDIIKMDHIEVDEDGAD
jgi:hypothetical protein